jgi:hypothetical protein
LNFEQERENNKNIKKKKNYKRFELGKEEQEKIRKNNNCNLGSNQGERNNKNIKKNNRCERIELQTKKKGVTRTSRRTITPRGLNQGNKNNKNIRRNNNCERFKPRRK